MSRSVLVFTCGCALVALVFSTLRYLTYHPAPHFLMDDALMFSRYAGHVIEGHGIVWNIGEGPVYGCTSLAYLGAVIVLKLLGLPDALALTLLSLGFLVPLFACLAELLRVALHTSRAASYAWLAVFVGPSLVLSPLASVPFNGIETTLSAATMGFWILLAQQGSQPPFRWLGILGALSFWVRPELAGLTLGSLLLWSALDRPERKNLLTGAAIGFLLLLGILLVNTLVFKSPIPLAALLKSGRAYGDFNYAAYEGAKYRLFVAFLEAAVGAVVVLGGSLLLRPRSFWQDLPPFGKALSALSLLLVAYHLFGVTAIMGNSGRYYWPILPVFVYLAGFALRPIMGRPFVAQVGAIACGLAVLASGIRFVLGITAGHFYRPTWSLLSIYKGYRADLWLGLDEISNLPDDARLAATEVGLPGAMNPGKPLLDMAGLNDHTIALDPSRVTQRLLEFNPDLVYMPHADYLEMNRQLRSDVEFQHKYELFITSTKGYNLDVALRRGSPYYSRMRYIIRSKLGEVNPEATHE